MVEKEEVIEILEQYKEHLEKYKVWLDEKSVELKSYFFEAYKEYTPCNDEGEEMGCNENSYEKLLNDNYAYVNRQIEFVNDVLKLDVVQENNFSRQIKVLLLQCISIMKEHINFVCCNEMIFEIPNYYDFYDEYNSILILSNFSKINNNVVLIGSNGSGKSSLANALKGNDTENICVIPAQKTLFFSLRDMSILSTRMKNLEELLLENNIYKSKMKDSYGYFEFQNNQFTKLIIAMKEEYIEYLIDCEEKQIVAKEDSCVFGELRKLFEIIFPEIKLSFKSDSEDYLNCVKSDKTYHINALSEGEKAVIYYAVSVFMAKPNSFIVVDEPETYLNPSLTNVLWDYLISVRKDCQFIFITHSVDFVLGRNEAKIAWIKNFKYPDKWDIEFIEDDFTLPKNMITEVLGTKKPIIFCEGDDKSSLDFAVYNALLGKSFTVLPVGGHMDVIKNCEVLSSTHWINIEVMGLIDGDNYSVQKISSLNQKGIKVLPFNEIEMFLLSNEVLIYTMRNIFPQNYTEKISKYKEAFFKLIEERKDKIALDNVVSRVNEYIAKEKIQSNNNISSIEENLKTISQYDIRSIYNEKIEQISEAVNNKDYNELLKICNLKKEISRGLANLYLDNDYENKALQQIQTNIELQETLKKNILIFENEEL